MPQAPVEVAVVKAMPAAPKPPPEVPRGKPEVDKKAKYKDGSYWRTLGTHRLFKYILRMRRYFEPETGESEASAEAMEMYKDVKKRSMAAHILVLCLVLGDQLREIYVKHGNFAAMEVEVSKLSKQSQRNKLEGGWYNSVTLATEKKWTQCFGCGDVFVKWFVQGNDYP